MPKKEMPSGALALLILRVLRSSALHGYAIAQRIHLLSSDVLHVEEGALYPALQKMLLKGWVTSEWGISENNRKARFYRLTGEGRKQLASEANEFNKLVDDDSRFRLAVKLQQHMGFRPIVSRHLPR